MSDIQSLIKMLQSENSNKRYDACEELRVSPQPLPQEAMDAFKIAYNDVNPGVADATQRALVLHALQPKNEGGNLETNTAKTNKERDFMIGIAGWFITYNLLFILFVTIFELLGLSKGMHAYVVSLAIWLVVAIFIRLLVIKRRFWICSGVATTVIINIQVPPTCW